MICLQYKRSNEEESLGFFMTRNLLPSAFRIWQRTIALLSYPSGLRGQ